MKLIINITGIEIFNQIKLIGIKMSTFVRHKKYMYYKI